MSPSAPRPHRRRNFAFKVEQLRPPHQVGVVMSGVKPMQVCTEPGCPTLVQHGRCPGHRRPDRRPSAAARGYDHKWRRNKGKFLTANPTCEDCGKPATDADHIPDRAELVARGEPHPDAWRWLHPVCHPCHSRRTRARQLARGGGAPLGP